MRKCRRILYPGVALMLMMTALIGGAGRVFGDWQLTWSDEFSASSIDLTKWTFDTGTGPPYLGWGNNELEDYTTRATNAYVTNGILHIVARQENYSGSLYTSAKMKSVGLFSQKYGRFEFYAKLPTGQGYWPALWMMPEDSAYGGWAASGEIDLMENRGSDATTVLGTIHFGGIYPNQSQSFGPSFKFPGGDGVTNFHLYALEWSSNSIKWYVDSTLYETQTSWWSSSNPTNTSIRNPYPAPFDQPFYILMNLAVGGNFGGNPNGSTFFPGDMQVDYVRAYEWVGAPPPPPPPPILKLRVPLYDSPGSTTNSSDVAGGGVNVPVQILNGAGSAADLHGAANSGVAGVTTGYRALDFTSNTAQPGNPGPIAATTNSNLGFGTVSNFVVSLWFKQNSMMTPGGNIGPRLFVLGTGAPGDTGAADSIGLKFQTASQLYFQMGGITASATFPTNLPAGVWLFLAAAYDGSNVTLYQGSETNAVTVVGTTSASTNVNFGSNSALYLGNRQNLQRSFDGWLADFRFYTGIGDGSFIEAVRESALVPSRTIAIRNSGSGVLLNWGGGGLQAAAGVTGPWGAMSNAASPFTVVPNASQQYYRLQLPGP